MPIFGLHNYNVTIDINSHLEVSMTCLCMEFDPFKPEFTIVIFIHYIYKPQIAVAILDL